MADIEVKSRYGVGSVDIAMRMLKVMVDFRRPVLLSEVARELGVSPGKVHRYFVSFLRTGLITKQPETGKYELGAFSLHIGLAALEQVDPVRFASERLAALRDEVGLTVLLAVWGDVGPVVVRIEESADRLKMNVRVGSVLQVLTTAVGRVFMAYLPANQAAALIRNEKGRRASVAKMSVQKISADVRRSRASRIDSFGLPGIAVLAAPILDHHDYPAAVVAVLSLKDVDRLSLGGNTARALHQFVAQVSDRLGNGHTRNAVARLQSTTGASDAPGVVPRRRSRR